MIASPTSANLRDFTQRHVSTWGWFLPEDRTKKVLVYVENVDRHVHFMDHSNTRYFANVNGGAHFEFLPIVRGWYYTEKRVVLLQRIPARQYSRGISTGNTSVNEFSSSGNLGKTALSFELLQDIFVNKPTRTLEDFLSQKTRCFLLNKYFCIDMVGNYIWMYDRRIGEWDYKTRTITLTEPLFKQELLDAISRNSYPFVVK